jgi:hypothetical protein
MPEKGPGKFLNMRYVQAEHSIHGCFLDVTNDPLEPMIKSFIKKKNPKLSNHRRKLG